MKIRQQILLLLCIISLNVRGQMDFYKREIIIPDTINHLVKFNLCSKSVIVNNEQDSLRFCVLKTLSYDTIFKESLAREEGYKFRPSFFVPNKDELPTILMIDPVTEFSNGQHVYLIYSDSVFYSGFIDWVVDIGNGQSIANYCSITSRNGVITMELSNVQIFSWLNPEVTIQGKNWKFEISRTSIEMKKHAL
jgi:hypothetical protein